MRLDLQKLLFATEMDVDDVEAMKGLRKAQWIKDEANGDSWMIAIFVDNPLFDRWFDTLWENRLYIASVAMRDVSNVEANRAIFRQYTNITNLDAYPTGEVYEDIKNKALNDLRKCKQEASI
ncbi:hypothetical protein SDC9_55041 [bioreactor metagenome]|uniref:Uncharacterized protein n=1 Tax=bioreactor metagenome TaxID=1076179 RepID=A0A644WYE6_9ZZZZ